MFKFTLITLAVASLAVANPLASRQSERPSRQYFVHNNCATDINLFIAGELDSNIPQGETLIKTMTDNAGYFYTDANGGSSTTAGTVRVAFSADYYYLVKDNNSVNVELQVSPRGRTPSNGFCQTISCGSPSCTQAFPAPPTRFPNSSTVTPPPVPYFSCPIADTDYDITFCPSA